MLNRINVMEISGVGSKETIMHFTKHTYIQTYIYIYVHYIKYKYILDLTRYFSKQKLSFF